ncbi:pilus assembly protein PilM [Patescibacteria group bacterium]|nr:pilus assembly protein PilM [Patescibacteria group bacterium]
MGIFSKKDTKTPGLLGVDIGAGGIKVVEIIPESGRPRLATYGYSTMKEPENTGNAIIDDAKRGANILSQIIKNSGMKSMKANASLPSHSVFHAIITIPQPKDEKADVKSMIETQVKKLLPLPIENMILDSTIIDKHLMPQVKKEEKKNPDQLAEKPTIKEFAAEKQQQYVRVLVSGAPKDLVQKYVALFKVAKIELVALETEAFALIRSLVGKDKARIMIVDIGFERTNITIVHDGIPFLHRSIKAGGEIVTEMISKQMGISLKEAEQAKLDLAFSKQDSIPQVLKDSMAPILHEIRYSLELYAQQNFHDNNTVEKIILTGGSAHLPYIDPYLTENLNISVYLGDPWARVSTPSGLRPVLDEIGPRFSVSLGLAMKGIK